MDASDDEYQPENGSPVPSERGTHRSNFDISKDPEEAQREPDQQQDFDDSNQEQNLQPTAQPVVQTRRRAQIDRDARLRALRNRIGAAPHTTSMLLTILGDLNWNVDQAEAFFHMYTANMRNRRRFFNETPETDGEVGEEHEQEGRNLAEDVPAHEPNTQDNLGPTFLGGFTIEEHLEDMDVDRINVSDTIAGHDILHNGNADLERRNAVMIFADIVNEQFNILLSRSEAALALGIAKWDLERAVEFYSDGESVQQIRAVLSEYFDRMRPQPNGLQSEKDAQAERDQRLAILITLTGFTSWYSAQAHLSRHQYNLVAAVAGWVRTGIKPSTHPEDRKGRAGAGFGRRFDFDGHRTPLPNVRECYGEMVEDDDETWAQEPDIFMNNDTRAGIDIYGFQKSSTGSWSFPIFGRPKKDVKLKDGKVMSRRPGGVINCDTEPARPGAPDWTKLSFEYIQKGKYFSFPYKNKTQLLSDHGENRSIAEGGTRADDDTRTEMFDWNDKKHLGYLRKWSGQKLTRVTQTNLRDAGQRLSVEEKQFLKRLIDEVWKQHEKANPTKTRAELFRSFQVPNATKEAWGPRWNTRFAGKTVASQFEPRRERRGRNLYTLIKRWKKLCDLYGMTFDKTGTATDKNEDRWPWEASADSEDEDMEDDEAGDDADLDEEGGWGE